MKWFKERFQISGLLDFLKSKTVPVHFASPWYAMGGLLITFLSLQVITGMALLFYYQPTPETACESVRKLALEVPYGWLIRSVHCWSASLMIAVAFVHLFSTMFLRSYRRPRELTWVSGMGMFMLLLVFGFSGYLLPWNELSFFATKVGTGIAGKVPLFGDWLKYFLRGGEEVGAATLTRFFGLHVVILPALLMTLMAAHLFFVQIQGMSLPVELEPGKEKLKKVAFFPDFLLREAALACLAVALVVTLAVLFPWELGRKADPLLATPEGIHPEWYFLFLFKTLELIPAKIGPIEGEVLGIFFTMAGFLFIVLVPFLDRRAGRDEKSPRITWAGLAAVGYIVFMTLWAVFGSAVVNNVAQPDVLQKEIAHRYVLELVIFLTVTIGLALALWLMGRDRARLRESDFFAGIDGERKDG